ncbi:MAG: toll/interleukin-1 receptor domain-containing protein [Anaerolineae bacterium]|nr:toll/interleukin-1 receptor domain-containing protein [Anaerolineae bacterium]
MHRVFISYRRADSEEMASKIHDRLSASLQTSLNPNPVFLDTSDLHAGAELRTEILKILNDVDVLLVIIGTQWLTTTLPGQEQPRIFDPVDFLHREVRYGLSEWAARDMNVIPVLVNGAKMPLESQLPGSLRELAEISGFTLTSGTMFGAQMEKLTDDIRLYIQEADKRRLVQGLTIVRDY